MTNVVDEGATMQKNFSLEFFGISCEYAVAVCRRKAVKQIDQCVDLLTGEVDCDRSDVLSFVAHRKLPFSLHWDEQRQ